VTNIVPAQIGANFSFYLYTGDCKDKNDKSIEGRGRRADLFRKGVWDNLLKDMPAAQKDVIQRAAFFAGSFFFSGRPIPGLEQENLPQLVVDGSETAGDTLTLVRVQKFAAPDCLQPPLPPTQQGEIVVETNRCSTCLATFQNEQALMQHCKQTGHELVYPAKNSLEPAKTDVFLAYLNTALQRALGERCKKWGNEYIDEDRAIQGKDRNGRDLGIKVFEAYSCKFGVMRNTTTAGPKAKLILTVDLRAKVMRTVTVLDMLNRIQETDQQWSSANQNRARRQWIGERVMYTRERKGYTVVGLDFDNSPRSLPVPQQNVSHEEYFKKKGIMLEYPDHVPMVVVLGRQDREIYLPAELVTGTELETNIKEQLPMIASFKPEVRSTAIDQVRKFLMPGGQGKKKTGALLPALGVQLENSRMTVAAKVMSVPSLITAGVAIPERFSENWAPQIGKSKFSIHPNQANQLKGILFYNGMISKNSAIEVYSLISKYVNSYQSSYRLSEKPFALLDAGKTDREHIAQVQRYFATSQDANVFVLDFVKPKNAADGAYPVVKQMLGKGGYVSQFVSFKTYPHDKPRDERKSDMILRGVARQILQKSGVMLWWAKIPRSLPLPVAFVGVDVYHCPPSYDQEKRKRVRKPSVAAIVVHLVRDANPDSRRIEIFSQTFKQEGGQEFELEAAYRETLSTALKTFNCRPASCVCWRDGIVDGVRYNDEIRGLRAGLAATVGQAQSPVEIAYITCQKRIDNKFFLQNGGSAPPGTQVAAIQGIDPGQMFYLNGRAPPYSTSKPVRFNVIKRDKSLMKVPVSELTWGQMHVYPNWTGSIKVPNVCQMAHKLAELAGNMSDSGDSIEHRRYANKVHFL